jgi:hypothetical protein
MIEAREKAARQLQLKAKFLASVRKDARAAIRRAEKAR